MFSAFGPGLSDAPHFEEPVLKLLARPGAALALGPLSV